MLFGQKRNLFEEGQKKFVVKEIDLVPTFHPRAFGMNRNRKWNVEVIGEEKNGGGIGTAKCMFIQLKAVLYCFKKNLIFHETHQLCPDLKR